jgi:multidrug transporter EmrE-like cation transporter
MTPVKIVGIILIVVGAAALAMGSFSYTKETHQAKIGPLQLSVEEKQSVNVPQWLGIASIALGVILLIVPGRRK